ncbi:MAG: hypothetical protein WCT02_00940 [Candidatus Paceibacterota bacterium]
MSPTKHTHHKTVAKETKNKGVAAKNSEEEDLPIDLTATKAKKAPEIDLIEEVLVTEEKVDPEAPVVEDGEDAEGEEVTLDDEDLNPFGDKWEQ